MNSSAVLPDAHAEYGRRLEQLRSDQARYAVIDRRMSYARFAAMICGAALAIWLILSKTHSPLWIALPMFLFVAIAIAHQPIVRAIERVRRAIAFYERGLKRLSHEWMGNGQDGERFLNDSHPYARDLDIFGTGSIFELICTARTRAGEETLAGWLLSAASPEEVLSRQAAVEEMREKLAFREEIAVLSETIDAGVKPEALAKWAEATDSLGPQSLRATLALLTLLWLGGLALWAASGFWYVAAAMTLVNAIVAARLGRRASECVSEIEAAVHDIALLARVLSRVEHEKFTSAKLIGLQRRLRGKGSGVLASVRVERLARLCESLASRRNMIIGGLDRFIFWIAQYELAIEAWRSREGAHLRGWLAAVGEIEALNDLANYAYEHPEDVFPEFAPDAPCFHAEGLAHPLLPEAASVRNDLALGRDLRLLIISGPNMAGKSTFVRAVGVNAVLAQCGAPVRAKRLKMSLLAVAASVCVLDSLQGGVSRFYAEITRLKLIMDMARGPVPVLYLLDELLSGTNSHDRRIGAEAIVRGLYERNAVGLVTTHDLALATIAGDLGAGVANFHFEDHIENGKLRFDYRLAPGVVQTSNALVLMRSIGLDV